MSDKKKKELSPEELGIVAGGTEINPGQPQRGDTEPSSEAERIRGGSAAGGELDIETMQGVHGGVARTGTEAGGMTGRESSDGTHSRTREDEEGEGGGGILPSRRSPNTPT